MASKEILSGRGGTQTRTQLRDTTDIEAVQLLGNTLGIGASEALAKALESQKNLEVN